MHTKIKTMTNTKHVKFFTLLSLCFLTVVSVAQQIDMSLFNNIKPRNIGPAGMSGRVTAIDVVLHNPDHIYIGTASGGLWHSKNGGTSWTPVFENEKAASVGAVAINQQNPHEIWIGTGEGNPRNSLTSGYGVYKTIDGGKSWQHMGLEKTRNIHRVIVHPRDPNTVWIGAIGSPWGEHAERGVFKTTDGGKTWRKVLFVNNKTGVADFIIDPSNPNHLIAAMWEHRRWPWFFKSGGEGSGLYVSYDGGENWTKKTEAEGLPKGELGRMGISFAPSKPNMVYALIEAKKTGLYKSEDGGDSWKLVTDKGVSNRPFYYADLFVDTKNENRLYHVQTTVEVSQDGGKNWENFIPPSLIHVDNHAWWQHPDDSEFIINGNDGGLAISRDGGDTWDFPENLPLAQFYHIRVDNEVPYNVYGGLQDNGSWRGPSQVWRRGGIRNFYWDRIGGGDGFDAAPDPLDPRFGYSLSQGGNLGRYDLKTGEREGIRPFLASGEDLRFNWNTALAIDPFDQKTLYVGSQFVLKSSDHGRSWEKISPDLTTNDPEKQKYNESGGLTYDATGAENHTTIITIDPSPVQQGLIWAGTDDGKIHVTQNGGGNWTDVTKNIKGVPEGSWVAQITASAHNAGEAFAVINNYRRDDWTPFLFRTNDFGKTWTRLVDENDVWGYTLSFVQDPVEPKLMFLGTEFGLYVSIDAGANWTQWTNGYPTVSTMDLAIQPREHDLVIGTFGRAVWILDDIRPLRELAAKGLNTVTSSTLHFSPIPDAYLASMGEANGYRSTGHGLFAGENREQGALISYFVKEAKEKAEAKVEVFDAKGNLIRTLKHSPKKGWNRFAWELDVKGIRFPNQAKPRNERSERGGRNVVPGEYTVKITYDGQEASQKVMVKPDPNIPSTQAEMIAKATLIDDYNAYVEGITATVDVLRDAEASVDFVTKRLNDIEDKNAHKELREQSKQIKDQIKELMGLVTETEEVQGIYRNDKLLGSILRQGASNDVIYPVTPAQEQRIAIAKREAKPIVDKIDAFLKKDWEAYKQAVEKAKVSLL